MCRSFSLHVDPQYFGSFLPKKELFILSFRRVIHLPLELPDADILKDRHQQPNGKNSSPPLINLLASRAVSWMNASSDQCVTSLTSVIFLLSSKAGLSIRSVAVLIFSYCLSAGGVGINLIGMEINSLKLWDLHLFSGASRLCLIDSDWNPRYV